MATLRTASNNTKHDVDDDNTISRRKDSSCCMKCIKCENIICSTGNAWGYLDEKPKTWFVLWWFIRHLIYFGIAATLLITVPKSAFFVVPFFIIAHVYKAVRLCLISTEQERKKRSVSQNKDTIDKDKTSYLTKSSKKSLHHGTDDDYCQYTQHFFPFHSPTEEVSPYHE